MTVPRDTIGDSPIGDTPVGDTPDATWLSKARTCQLIGVNERTLERLAREWGIRCGPWRRPTGGAVVMVYHPGDVARVASERPRTALAGILVADGDLPRNGNGHQPPTSLVPPPPELQVSDDRLVPALRLFAELVRGVSPIVSPTVSPTAPSDLSDDRYYALADVATWKGLTVRGVWKRLRSSEVVPFRDAGQWKIRGSDARRL